MSTKMSEAEHLAEQEHLERYANDPVYRAEADAPEGGELKAGQMVVLRWATEEAELAQRAIGIKQQELAQARAEAADTLARLEAIAMGGTSDRANEARFLVEDKARDRRRNVLELVRLTGERS